MEAYAEIYIVLLLIITWQTLTDIDIYIRESVVNGYYKIMNKAYNLNNH